MYLIDSPDLSKYCTIMVHFPMLTVSPIILVVRRTMGMVGPTVSIGNVIKGL